MKQVSTAYKNSMRSMLRNRSLVQVSFSNVDTSAAGDGEWNSNGAEVYSEVSTLDHEYVYQDTYATLELNRWGLDGKSLILPSDGTVEDGFVSSLISDANGDFVTKAVLTRQFTNPHTLPGFTLVFDTRSQEWPFTVNVDFYLNDIPVLQTSSPVTGTKVEFDTPISSCDKIVITFGSTLPYRRPRLQEVLYGLGIQFGNTEIVSTKQSHDVDPLSRRLPKETMDFTILDYNHRYDPDNPSGIYAYIDKNAPASIRFGYTLPDGTVEWLKPDKYVLNGRPTAKNNQASFSGVGLIGSLSDIFYKSRLGSKNLYDMAVEVLEDANLPLTKTEEKPWIINESLKQMYTTAALPIATHMNCLQLIAHAACSRLYTDDDNIIHIEPFGVTKRGIYKGSWEDNGHLWYSEWDSVAEGNASMSTYTTLELNRWLLDGENQVIIPDNNPSGRGYISEQMTGNDGSFSESPIFSRVFDVSQDLSVLSLRFNYPLGEHPTSIQVRYYSRDTLLDTQNVTVSSSEITVQSNLAVDCTRFEITVLNGLPYRRVRVERVYFRQTDFSLNFSTIRENSEQVSKIDQLKAVTVAKYSYLAEDAAQTLFEGTTAETQLHVEFSGLAQDVEIAVTGGSLISSDIYARAVDLVLSSGTKTVTVTGKPLSENSVIVSYPVSSEGEIDNEENPLITNDDLCVAVSNHVKAYLQMRNTYDATYRGNPEIEVGDIIGLQTLYTPDMDALILTNELTFNGALSGKLKVKGLI